MCSTENLAHRPAACRLLPRARQCVTVVLHVRRRR
jgi:hypothetical protein